MSTHGGRIILSLALGFGLWLILAQAPQAAGGLEGLRFHLPNRFADVAPLVLSDVQRERLQSRNGVRAGIWLADLEPLDLTSDRNRYLGISADYLALIQARLGMPIRLSGFARRQDAVLALRRGEVDLLTSASAIERAATDIALSQSYLLDRSIGVVRSAQGTAGVRAGSRIVLLEGHERLAELREAYPGSDFILAPDLYSALEAVSQGDADAFIGNQLIVRSHLALRAEHPWRVVPLSGIADAGFAFATRAGDSVLGALIDQALSSIEPAQHREILMRWATGLGADLAPYPVELSDAERAWMTAHPQVRVVASHYPPYIAQDAHGNWQGLNHDLLQRISSLTGLQFDYVFSHSVSDTLQALRDGRAEMATTLSQASERDFLLFSHGLGGKHWVLVENAAKPPLESLSALAGQVLVLPAEHVLARHIRENYPDIILREVQTLHQARDWVRKGLAAATIDTESAASRALGGAHSSSLRLGRRVEGESSVDRLAVSARHPLLASIIDKAVEALPVEEVRAARVKWLGAPAVSMTLWQRVPPWVYWAVGGALLFGAATAIWSGRLRWQIAQRQRLEQQLVEATRVAQEASAAKSRFLATVSHDMRTPLSAIIGLLELERAKAVGHNLSPALETALQSANDLVSLIGDTLDIARIEAGKLELVLEPQALRPFLERVMQLFAGLAYQRELKLSLELCPRAEGVFLFDPLRVRQVLHNLLGNALKFTAKGGVTLKVRWYAEDPHTGLLKLYIIDTGVGLDPRQQASLFQPFVQDVPGAAGNSRGAGLGLSICKQLVDLMEGCIALDSRPGVGTQVTVELPLQRLADNPTYLLPSELPSGEGEASRVLVVDDVSIHRAVLSQQLEHLGCTVVAVASGQDALLAWQQQPFDLVFTDCRMPAMDGFSLTRQLRALEAQRRCAATIILGSSAQLSDEDIACAREAGMNRLMSKPIALGTLRICTCCAFDHDALHRLACGDAKVLRRLTTELTRDLRAERMALLAVADEPTRLRACVHRLSGIACLIGATPLAKACAVSAGDAVVQAAELTLLIEQVLLQLARQNVGEILPFFGKFPISAN